MFEIKENHRVVDHEKVTTYSRKVVGANILEVEAGTTGFCGGDGGHGGRTYFRVQDLAGTAIDVFAIDGGRGFEVALAGDSELETIVASLKFITQVLEEELLEVRR